MSFRVLDGDIAATQSLGRALNPTYDQQLVGFKLRPHNTLWEIYTLFSPYRASGRLVGLHTADSL